MRTARAAAALTLFLAALTACGTASGGDGLSVVASTEVIADLVANVGGERVTVDTVVPPGGDPHSYEPSPGDAVKVAKADVAFTNHLLLEEHALVKLFDANVGEGVPNISLAEHAEAYGATLIPLVEDLGLDVPWLGFAVRGAESLPRTASVELAATDVDGPGGLAVYLTDALGEPEVYIDSSDGLGPQDRILLPPDAHTHVNWAFTAPGDYTLSLAARVDGVTVAEGSFGFAVGTTVPGGAITGGHADLAVDVAARSLVARTDTGDRPTGTVIEVPERTAETVPDDPRFAFLGTPGSRIHQLPQAVLGKHVHGEIDPHLWQDVRNAAAYVHVIADTLIAADPGGRQGYESRRDAYLATLSALHTEVGAQIAAIPAQNRRLVTTHDAFGYLAKAYGLTVAGFVVPNPAAEPSAAQVERLTGTIRDLGVKAVFVEPNLAARAQVLRQVAWDLGVRVCRLHGDALPAEARTYVDMMRQNAAELRTCLGGGA